MKMCNKCPNYSNKYKTDRCIGYCSLRNIEFIDVITQANKCKYYTEISIIR